MQVVFKLIKTANYVVDWVTYEIQTTDKNRSSVRVSSLPVIWLPLAQWYRRVLIADLTWKQQILTIVFWLTWPCIKQSNDRFSLAGGLKVVNDFLGIIVSAVKCHKDSLKKFFSWWANSNDDICFCYINVILFTAASLDISIFILESVHTLHTSVWLLLHLILF